MSVYQLITQTEIRSFTILSPLSKRILAHANWNILFNKWNIHSKKIAIANIIDTSFKNFLFGGVSVHKNLHTLPSIYMLMCAAHFFVLHLRISPHALIWLELLWFFAVINIHVPTIKMVIPTLIKRPGLWHNQAVFLRKVCDTTH